MMMTMMKIRNVKLIYSQPKTEDENERMKE